MSQLVRSALRSCRCRGYVHIGGSGGSDPVRFEQIAPNSGVGTCGRPCYVVRSRQSAENRLDCVLWKIEVESDYRRCITRLALETELRERQLNTLMTREGKILPNNSDTDINRYCPRWTPSRSRTKSRSLVI